MTLQQKLAQVQTEFKSKKSRFNSFGKYYFRSAEDILEALKPFNKKYNVYFTVNEKYLGEGVIESTATIFDSEGANFIAAVVTTEPFLANLIMSCCGTKDKKRFAISYSITEGLEKLEPFSNTSLTLSKTGSYASPKETTL